MKASIEHKLDEVRDRFDELTALMSERDAASDRDRFTALSREYAELEPVVQTLQRVDAARAAVAEAEQVLAEGDPELRELAEDDLQQAQTQLQAAETELEAALMPRDPEDQADVFLEIRAGTGGDEAALFAGDLLRMYSRYAESCGWRLEILSARDAELGGYKEVICRVAGQDVYGHLKFESGAHRVQRVPETESQGRIHTSACTVAVLPEPEAVDDIEVTRDDLRIDTFRASGAGGQHVNKTDSAIRITHLPSGLVVECQDERSQHKNRARAMALLQAKLTDIARQQQVDAQAESRRNLVGSGDRSERIRTYNFPQGRLTDHRINLTLYALDDIMQGNLEPVIDPLRREHQADLLTALGQ